MDKLGEISVLFEPTESEFDAKLFNLPPVSEVLEHTNAYKNTALGRLTTSTQQLTSLESDPDKTMNENNLSLKFPIRKKKVLKSKVKTWLTKPDSLYLFNYTWLPQPMIRDTVIQVKSPENLVLQCDAYNGMSKKESMRASGAAVGENRWIFTLFLDFI